MYTVNDCMKEKKDMYSLIIKCEKTSLNTQIKKNRK